MHMHIFISFALNLKNFCLIFPF
uniref:Uncharacterized protein n=1 Tax=Arundo donax TaxID=35708 RepID=A0A0A9H0B4_ARUDO